MTYFDSILTNFETDIPLFDFIFKFLLTTLLSWVISIIYKNYSAVLSNKKNFSNNLIIIATTTMLIISIVKSSLALSLGLVGALSIIRFRTAIKEPEELSYLFIAISIGLGIGADQIFVTITAFILTSFLLIMIYYLYGTKMETSGMILSIEIDEGVPPSLNKIISILETECSFIQLRRHDFQKNNLEALFTVRMKNIQSLENIKDHIEKINQHAKISFINQEAT
tara:strand:+ start:641 stop:1315 length:675 start_codon:yes stop_codon:yes gene_type:complete